MDEQNAKNLFQHIFIRQIFAFNLMHVGVVPCACARSAVSVACVFLHILFLGVNLMLRFMRFLSCMLNYFFPCSLGTIPLAYT